MATLKKQVEKDVEENIMQLKKKICESEGASLNGRVFSLYLHGNELHDNQFVGDCEISDDSEIDVLIKPLQKSTVTTVTPATLRWLLKFEKIGDFCFDTVWNQ